jgi:hypothetical protein
MILVGPTTCSYLTLRRRVVCALRHILWRRTKQLHGHDQSPTRGRLRGARTPVRSSKCKQDVYYLGKLNHQHPPAPPGSSRSTRALSRNRDAPHSLSKMSSADRKAIFIPAGFTNGTKNPLPIIPTPGDSVSRPTSRPRKTATLWAPSGLTLPASSAAQQSA